MVLDAAGHGSPVSVARMSDGEAAVRVGAALMASSAGNERSWSGTMTRILDALRDVEAWRAVGGPPDALARAVAEVAAA